jgi:hypothetical protein
MSKAERSNLSIINLHEEPHYHFNKYRFECEEGYLSSTFHKGERLYIIDNYRVKPDQRNNGYGKDFLRTSLEHAISLGSTAVAAIQITSRESLDAIETVFGSDHLTIHNRGSYACDLQPDEALSTSARFFFNIN